MVIKVTINNKEPIKNFISMNSLYHNEVKILKPKGLMALGLKSLPRRIWTGGHYRSLKPIMLEDCSLVFVCENSDGSKQWHEKILPTSLHMMGLRRDEDTFRIEKHNIRIDIPLMS